MEPYRKRQGETQSVGYDLQNGGAAQRPRNPQRISNPEVDLSNQQLRCIPPYIYDHPRIHTLILAHNLITEVPRAIGSLRQLRKLCVDDNQLTSVTENLSNCTKLEHLSLADNRLSLLPANIGNLSSLNNLNIADNQFESIPYEVGMLDHLTELNLKGNQLWYLPFSVENLRRLRKLDLSDNNFEHLPMPVCHIPSLVSLSIHGNQLLSLAPVFQRLQNLHELNLADNRLAKIPPPVCKLQNLRYLNLGSNQISEIPIDIANLTKLKVLHVPGNSLRNFPNTLSNLRYLNISHNQILNFSVAGMKKLRYINADSNHLENVPLALYNLPNLEHLKLNDNNITFLSQDIALLKDLKTLDVGNNQLTSLPHVISELQHLDYFNVTGNEINQRFLTAKSDTKHRENADKSWIRQKIDDGKRHISATLAINQKHKHFNNGTSDKPTVLGPDLTRVDKEMMNTSLTELNVIGVSHREKNTQRKNTEEKVKDWQKTSRRTEDKEDSQSSDTDFQLLGVCSEIESMLSKQLFKPVFSGMETLPKNFRKKNIVKTPDGLWHLSDGDTTSTQTCDSSVLFTPKKPDHQNHHHQNHSKHYNSTTRNHNTRTRDSNMKHHDSHKNHNDSNTRHHDSNTRHHDSNTKHNDSNTRHHDSNTKHNDSNTRHHDSNTKHNDSNTRHHDSNTKHNDSNTRHHDSNMKYNDSNMKYKDSNTRHNDSNTRHKKPPRHLRRNSYPDVRVSGVSEFNHARRRTKRKRSRTMENLMPSVSNVVRATPAIHTQTDHFTVTTNGGTFISASDPRIKLVIPPNTIMTTHKIIMQVVKMFAETIVAAQEQIAAAHNILSISDIVHLHNTAGVTLNHEVGVTIPLPYRARHGHVHVLTVSEGNSCVPYGAEYTESNGHATLHTWNLTGKVAVATKSKCPYKACHSVEQLLRYLRM